MICIYKIFNGFFNLNVGDFFVRSKAATRGHPFKVLKSACQHSFAQISLLIEQQLCGMHYQKILYALQI